MQCIAPLGPYSYASGADEKVVRVFEAPKNFIKNFSRICNIKVDEKAVQSAPEGASVPALGLSNKAVFNGEPEIDKYEDRSIPLSQNDQYAEAYFAPFSTAEPPTEENLLQNTLWPEIQKLYGHGYEIFSTAAHPGGSVLATACKAAKQEHAAVILWDTTSWQQILSLPAHALTVTQLAFSHTGGRLLSVSRDRCWCVYKRRSDDASATEPLYSRCAFSDRATAVHSRIIWSCAWTHDDKYFVTVARDKKAVVWGERAGPAGDSCLGPYTHCSVLSDINEPITAVHMAPVHVQSNEYLMAFGTDSGLIYIYRWKAPSDKSEATWIKCLQLSHSEAHHLTVKRLRFCPSLGDPHQGESASKSHIQLASCGADHTVKIYSINIEKL